MNVFPASALGKQSRAFPEFHRGRLAFPGSSVLELLKSRSSAGDLHAVSRPTVVLEKPQTGGLFSFLFNDAISIVTNQTVVILKGI